MIKIQQSITADSRYCDASSVTKEELIASTQQHIGDVAQALNMFMSMLAVAANEHDLHKLETIDHFHKCFTDGFKDTSWWDDHRRVSRHHIACIDDVDMRSVNLVDVIEYICDCVMAGMARSGVVYDVKINPIVLQQAFDNTVFMLVANVEVL